MSGGHNVESEELNRENKKRLEKSLRGCPKQMMGGK